MPVDAETLKKYDKDADGKLSDDVAMRHIAALPRLKPRCQCSPGLRAPPFWLRAQSCARRAALVAPFCWLLGSCAGFQCAREGIAGCRSPKGFRRPFNVVTRSVLKPMVAQQC